MLKKLSKRNKEYAGGFSEGVVNSEQFRRYTDGNIVSGWLGSGNRKKGRDKLLEKVLREKGLGDEGVAHWLCSKLGRWLSDHTDEKDTLVKFEKLVRERTADAFEMVTIWNHPDYQPHDKTDLARKLFPNHEYDNGYLVPIKPVVLTDAQKKLAPRMRTMIKNGISDHGIAHYFSLPERVVREALKYKAPPRKVGKPRGPRTSTLKKFMENP